MGQYTRMIYLIPLLIVVDFSFDYFCNVINYHKKNIFKFKNKVVQELQITKNSMLSSFHEIKEEDLVFKLIDSNKKRSLLGYLDTKLRKNSLESIIIYDQNCKVLEILDQINLQTNLCTAAKPDFPFYWTAVADGVVLSSIHKLSRNGKSYIFYINKRLDKDWLLFNKNLSVFIKKYNINWQRSQEESFSKRLLDKKHNPILSDYIWSQKMSFVLFYPLLIFSKPIQNYLHLLIFILILVIVLAFYIEQRHKSNKVKEDKKKWSEWFAHVSNNIDKHRLNFKTLEIDKSGLTYYIYVGVEKVLYRFVDSYFGNKESKIHEKVRPFRREEIFSHKNELLESSGVVLLSYLKFFYNVFSTKEVKYKKQSMLFMQNIESYNSKMLFVSKKWISGIEHLGGRKFFRSLSETKVDGSDENLLSYHLHSLFELSTMMQVDLKAQRRGYFSSLRSFCCLKKFFEYIILQKQVVVEDKQFIKDFFTKLGIFYSFGLKPSKKINFVTEAMENLSLTSKLPYHVWKLIFFHILYCLDKNLCIEDNKLYIKYIKEENKNSLLFTVVKKENSDFVDKDKSFITTHESVLENILKNFSINLEKLISCDQINGYVLKW
jgi:hypothetical protein